MTQRACLEDCDGEHHECPHCGGEGYVLGDCFEDTCCCADPDTAHDTVACEYCEGAGGWRCPELVAEG